MQVSFAHLSVKFEVYGWSQVLKPYVKLQKLLLYIPASAKLLNVTRRARRTRTNLSGGSRVCTRLEHTAVQYFQTVGRSGFAKAHAGT